MPGFRWPALWCSIALMRSGFRIAFSKFRWARRLLVGAAMLPLVACGVVAPLPPPTDLHERLSAFPTENLPLEGRVDLYWDRHQIPFIDAETDRDAAFVLGMVHAHLRLGQMETARRLSQGRLAEMAGPLPFVLDLDHALRILGYGRGADSILQAMPDETRAWLDHFTHGINHYLMTAEQLPHDFRVLGFNREPWTPQDILTIGRLAGTDINWLVWFSLLRHRDKETFADILAHELKFGNLAPTSLAATGADGIPLRRAGGAFGGDRAEADLEPGPEAEGKPRGHADRALAALAGLLEPYARGSNSLAIAGSRSASGSALIANDPHLGVNQPNLWILAGLRSPGFHVVGMMPTALPFFAIGRNPDIAWGGTNMRAMSSDLVDLSGMPEDWFETETHRLRSRFWFSTERRNRVSPFGPVISDAALVPAGEGETLALRWIGHTGTDEITALLRASRATTFSEFRAAFANFGVSAQTMLYADRHGDVGLVAAATLPRRDPMPPGDIVTPWQTVRQWWATLASTEDLPFLENPPQGFVASANNPPADSAVPLGWFFSAPDRIERMAELMGADDRLWTVEDLALLQQDTFSPSAALLRDELSTRLPASLGGTDHDRENLWRQILEWDGRFDAESRGALAFQAFHAPFAEALRAHLGREDSWDSGTGKWRVLAASRLVSDEILLSLAQQALDAARPVLERFQVWGDVHRMEVSTVLTNLPLLGGRYRFGSFPAPGSQETLFKSAHPETAQPHSVRYGSQARHISDLSDPDANYFVLLGGQDGWINSSTQLDQIDLWREGKLVPMPLRIDSVARRAEVSMRLAPASSSSAANPD